VNTAVTGGAGTAAGADGYAPTAATFFKDLQARICARFEAFEDSARFTIRPWSKPEGHRLQGGGESRLMRGEVFEKVGVNFSHVWGSFPPQFRGQVAGAQESDGRFTATGISLVAHMSNRWLGPDANLPVRSGHGGFPCRPARRVRQLWARDLRRVQSLV
jgi:coproporphyrinogen III oxidase